MNKFRFALAGLVGFSVGIVSPARSRADGHTDYHPPYAAPWSTPGDGSLVLLARTAFADNSGSFSKSMPVRARVCLTNVGGALDPEKPAVNLYVWTTKTYPGDLSVTEPTTAPLRLGECKEFENPAALILQAANVYPETSSGYYEMFQPDSGKYLTSFPPNNGLKLGNPIPSTVECKPIQAPGNSSFYQSCKLPLEADHTGIRICFGPNDINSSDGKTVYATSLLEMITDDSLLNKAPIGYDYRWNYVVPNGCRDIFDANVIYFLVGPADYKPTDYWNPSKVESVTPIIQYIDSH